MEYRSDDFLRQAGQLIFFGFDGYELNDHARRAISEYHLGNVILLTRNYRDPAQFYSLIQSLQQEAMEANGVPLLIAIDQEGGSVVRIMHDATWFPGPMATSGRQSGSGPAAGPRCGSGDGCLWLKSEFGTCDEPCQQSGQSSCGRAMLGSYA